MDLEGLVGERLLADGSDAQVRMTRQGALVSALAQGDFYENTARGHVFSMVLNQTTTGIAAGNVHGAAAAASTNFALWNPIGSGKNLSLLKFGVSFTSGTSPIPPVMHSMSITAPSIASVLQNPIQCNNTSKSASSVARGVSSAAGSAITGSSILNFIRMADLMITAGTAANLVGRTCTELINGDIVIAPGTCWVPTWASTAALLLSYSITWEEIDI